MEMEAGGGTGSHEKLETDAERKDASNASNATDYSLEEFTAKGIEVEIALIFG